MPLLNHRYPLDPTGVNPDNAVIGEEHSLTVGSMYRALAPKYGPYFTDSLVIFDKATNQRLVRNTHYSCVELLQEATLKYGKEINQLILITDQNVSNTVSVDYQSLGGNYIYDASAIVNMYETAMNDQRDVDWANVNNKPFEFTPTLHNHLLRDVYGWEYMVIALERIRNAIVLSDVPEFEALIEWVKQRVKSSATLADIDAGLPVDKFMTYEGFLYALDKHNFNTYNLEPNKTTIQQGTSVSFVLTSTNVPTGSVFYWTLEHINTDDTKFGGTSGIVNITNNRATFSVPVAPIDRLHIVPEGQFRVVVRRNGINGPIQVKSQVLTLPAFDPLAAFDYAMNEVTWSMLVNDWFDPRIVISPVSTFLIRG